MTATNWRQLKKNTNQKTTGAAQYMENIIFFITGIHPLLSELCSGKEAILLIKRYFMSLKLMQKIRKDRGKKQTIVTVSARTWKNPEQASPTPFIAQCFWKPLVANWMLVCKNTALLQYEKARQLHQWLVFIFILSSTRAFLHLCMSLWIDCNFSPFLAESPRSEEPGYWITGTFDTQPLEVLSGCFLSDK